MKMVALFCLSDRFASYCIIHRFPDRLVSTEYTTDDMHDDYVEGTVVGRGGGAVEPLE